MKFKLEINEANGIDSLVKELTKLTASNHHREASIKLAQFLKNKKWENVLNHLKDLLQSDPNINSKLSEEIYKYSQEILDNLLKDFKAKYPEYYEYVYKSL